MRTKDPAVLSSASHKRIADAIRTAEKSTCGEIYCVLARESDNYFYPAAFVVTLAILIISFGMSIVMETWWLSVRMPVFVYAQTLAIACALLIVALFPNIRINLVPRRLRYKRAHQAAIKQFLGRNVHLTAERTGVLIFVSLAERYAEIVADAGIDAKVDQAAWNEIVRELVEDARKDRLTDGFVTAIEKAGVILSQHFPPRHLNPNELDDHLVEI